MVAFPVSSPGVIVVDLCAAVCGGLASLPMLPRIGLSVSAFLVSLAGALEAVARCKSVSIDTLLHIYKL